MLNRLVILYKYRSRACLVSKALHGAPDVAGVYWFTIMRIVGMFATIVHKKYTKKYS